jgi:hypothetical protein
MKRLILILTILIFLCYSANARNFMVELKAHYFIPSEKAFKDIYGGGCRKS